MKVLIVSDTHRKDDNLERIIEEEAPFDTVSYTHLTLPTNSLV